MTFTGPAATPNADLAADILDLAHLAPKPTPDVPLVLTQEAITEALPGYTVSQLDLSTVGGTEMLLIRLDREGDTRLSVSITRVPAGQMQTVVRSEFGTFSAPLTDLTLHTDLNLDLLGSFAPADTYAVAVKGSFFTVAQGEDAKNTARVLTNLLFAR